VAADYLQPRKAGEVAELPCAASSGIADPCPVAGGGAGARTPSRGESPL